jgi:hypothetical protein
MAECTDPKSQKVSGAFPGAQGENSGALNVNLTSIGAEIFNPNLALSAVQTFNTMNSVANKMFGIEAIWFRAVPQQRSKDVIFQEYTLSCVDDTPLCIKVVVPGGKFPESSYQFDLMGLEYNIPTEIQIDKKYWEGEVGFGTAPQKKDIVYLPLPNKLFQVESSYLKRGFMEQETTWVINLIKYQPEASRKEGDALKETIDKYTVSESELFGELLQADMEKLTDKKQMSPFNSTSRDEYKIINPDLKIIPYNLDIWGIKVAESAYDLNTSSTYNAIEYPCRYNLACKNQTDIISVKHDRSITAWVNSRKDIDKPYDVVWIIPDDTLTYPANYKIKVSGKNRFSIDDVFVLERSATQNLYAKVIDDSNSNSGIYYCKIDKRVEDHLNSIQPLWYSKIGWKMRVKNPIVLIDGINATTTGFTVSIYADQYIKIKYGSQEYIAVMSDRLIQGNWYGVVVNIGNSWGQYNVYVWKPSLIDDIQKLQTVFYETLQFTPEETTVEQYSVDKSYSYMTNIRLFNSTIEEEKQVHELLSYFTQNADRAIILDNADPKFRAPYISQQR